MTPFQPAPRISLAAPVRGRRERICRGEEAEISRMLGPKKYAGMVERLQVHAPHSYDMTFDISYARDSSFQPPRVSSGNPANHILRFLALRFARALYPENFVNARELRLSRKSGSLVSAMYSDYVPDEGGATGRRTEFLHRFHSEDDRDGQDRVRAEADALEHAANPMLRRDMRVMEVSGIIIPHPEANYHLSGGNTVFVEVLGIDVRRAFAVVSELSQRPEEPLALLSLMCAVMFSSYSGSNRRFAASLDSMFPGIGFGEVYGTIYGMLAADRPPAAREDFSPADGLFHEMHSSMFNVHSLAHSMIREGGQNPQAPGWPVAIEKGLLTPSL
ncbi:MAG: hypothetical protein AB1324_07495 [Candidatus Micrarchaeota archaeon]